MVQNLTLLLETANSTTIPAMCLTPEFKHIITEYVTTAVSNNVRLSLVTYFVCSAFILVGFIRKDKWQVFGAVVLMLTVAVITIILNWGWLF